MERKFQTAHQGIDFACFPMKLWQKAKKHGQWDPQEIDFSQDRRDWEAMNELEKTVLLHLTSQFAAGEESVTQDLLPLIQAVGKTRGLEDEMYLTSFLFEEAKHVEVFSRFLQEVLEVDHDLSVYHGENYRKIFHEELPASMKQLESDHSPVAIARASVTYNMIVEGTLAETGYHAYHNMLSRNGLMPGMQEVTRLLNLDESRHIAYGVHLLSTLVEEHGSQLFGEIESRMMELFPLALGVVTETLNGYEELPFGLDVAEFISYAQMQFGRRYERIKPGVSEATH